MGFCRVVSMALVLGASVAMAAQAVDSSDSDHDGLSDALEQSLMARFAPQFQISSHDCSVAPASFTAGIAAPTVVADDATIYGQVFPVAAGKIEIHYYHLWRDDCGRLSHALDAEHVSALLTADASLDTSDVAVWHARYWYAAGHEGTVCDSSQVTRAATLNATGSGPKIWISAGKHASFLEEELCQHGCGGDACEEMVPLTGMTLVNLGEPLHPMSGAVWASAKTWPLMQKMQRSDFSEERMARVERLPDTDIVWANPAKRPAQATIFAGSVTVDSLAMSDRKTNTALVIAGNHTGNALSVSYDKVKGSLRKSARGVGRFLGAKPAKGEAAH